ncbi:hypothetical protein WA026_005161 [Henosepilachna vigintioctopunctata]|uniref:oleoyl-[acyl-carrier-protein] hydrolase n=1 Tax=Henosepilachna vigintioctopunctata TaxID=420089 RepID=A0AAW1UTW4_9CUCU
MVVGSKILQRPTIFQQALSALKTNGFILSREDLEFNENSTKLNNIDILTTYNTDTEKIILFRQSKTKNTTNKVIHVSNKDEDFGWLERLQEAAKNDEHTILYCQDEEENGLMGLFNCIRKEPGGMNTKCVLTFGNVPPFSQSEPFYERQLRKNMAVNVYKNGRWGTYRHLLMNNVEDVESEHFYANPLTRGDLSTIRWMEGELRLNSILPPGKTIVQIYYSPMNFRDVMTASGRISADVITMDRTKQECVQGFEFVGRDMRGRRVMGMMDRKALSTLVAADQYMLWSIPDHWTMEEAGTIPIVYTTVLFAFIQLGKIRRGESVLIHSGTGGVGQAAINIALSYGCEIFTTVGNSEKKQLLKKLFPKLKESHIGCSRDITFEEMVKKKTRGRGVDLVLNSLADDKLIASVRCLAPGGRFLEIGKFDLAKDSQLALMFLEGERSFHSVMMDLVMDSGTDVKKIVSDIFNQALRSGAVKPLNTTVFSMNEMEQAFRFMASGRHTGKVMIKIRDEEPEKIVLPKVTTFKGLPRYYCDSERSYVIVGGLGGFGLELADWLVLRGARRLILNSRNGVQNGYQSYRMRIWKSYGTLLKISTADVTTEEGCNQLISEAEEMGPVGGIFNLAVVLADSLLENQTKSSFEDSFNPKAVATKHLDVVTRRRCPLLRDFVVFSSVVCGRGNTGQTNYGMANSIMERICEKRKKDGFPGLAIEWGAVGDVGLVANMQELHTEIEIGGTLQQRINSCLQVMDSFLRQKESAIVSSIVVAEKKSGSGGADNIVDAVANILGIKKQTVSAHATLAEIGMDSMTAVEIKQTLEREFEVFLTAQDIRNLTLTRLQEIQSSGETTQLTSLDPHEPAGFQLVLRYIGDEASCKIPIVRLASLVEDESDAPLVFCFPGIEGFASTLKPMAAYLKAKVYGVQFCYDHPTSGHEDMVKEAITKIERIIKPNQPLHIITYSWGTTIGLDTMSCMEEKGYKGTLTCIDGSPELNSKMCQQELTTDTEEEFETILLCHFMALYMPYEIVKRNKEAMLTASNLQDRITVLIQASKGATSFSEEYLRASASAVYYRVKQVMSYEPKFKKIQSPARLCKPSRTLMNNLTEDYGLSEICNNFLGVSYFDGNHVSMLENIKLAESVNEFLGLN